MLGFKGTGMNKLRVLSLLNEPSEMFYDVGKQKIRIYSDKYYHFPQSTGRYESTEPGIVFFTIYYSTYKEFLNVPETRVVQ